MGSIPGQVRSKEPIPSLLGAQVWTMGGRSLKDSRTTIPPEDNGSQLLGTVPLAQRREITVPVAAERQDGRDSAGTSVPSTLLVALNCFCFPY